MRRAAAFIASMTVLVAGLAGDARATDVGPGCQVVSYSRHADCRMVFKGFPIYVFADVSAPGTASIHAWITLDAAPQSPVGIVDCTQTGAGVATCDKGLPNETLSPVGHYALEQFDLHCWVESNGVGQLQCHTADGR